MSYQVLRTHLLLYQISILYLMLGVTHGKLTNLRWISILFFLSKSTYWQLASNGYMSQSYTSNINNRKTLITGKQVLRFHFWPYTPSQPEASKPCSTPQIFSSGSRSGDTDRLASLLTLSFDAWISAATNISGPACKCFFKLVDSSEVAVAQLEGITCSPSSTKQWQNFHPHFCHKRPHCWLQIFAGRSETR